MNDFELAVQASLLGKRNIDRPYQEPVKQVSFPTPSFWPYQERSWWERQGDFDQVFWLLFGFPVIAVVGVSIVGVLGMLLYLLCK